MFRRARICASATHLSSRAPVRNLNSLIFNKLQLYRMDMRAFTLPLARSEKSYNQLTIGFTTGKSRFPNSGLFPLRPRLVGRNLQFLSRWGFSPRVKAT